MIDWFWDWGWMAWIVIGGIGYMALFIDDKVSPMAVVGSCVLGPLMAIPVIILWMEKRAKEQR